MNFKRYHVSKNLFDESTIEVGGLSQSTGEETTDSNRRRSGFIPVLPSTQYTISRPRTSTASYMWILKYHDDKTYIGVVGSVGDSFTFVTGTGTYFLRWYTTQSYDYTNVMLNTGSSPLPYEPYSSEVWHDIPHYIHNTSTDAITTLPADIYADGNNATVGLVGNMVQTGTPSPDSPITPQGCGDRTGNVLDYTTVENTSTATATQISGGISVSGRYYVQFKTVKFTVGSSYTMSWTAKTVGGTVTTMWRFRYSDNTYSLMPSSGGSLVVEKEVTALLLYVNTSSTASGVAELTNIMLNSGSTPLPYEKYGYKIPISSANTTTPVYLGEVETTRKIYKLVLTGQETGWNFNEPNNVFYLLAPNAMLIADSITSICTHYKAVGNKSLYINMSNNEVCIRANDTYLWIKDTTYSTVTDFKTYLQQQYANGTPVTVWYVLATPTTAIVNEPLRKISTYVDTVSGITIPTIAGKDTFDVLTTLKPSEVELTYTGWHDASAKEWDGSEWQ